MENFISSFHLDQYTTTEYANISGWVTSVIVLGGVVGSLVAAPLNDIFGRKKSLFLSGILYLVGCVIQISTSSNINQVIGARGLEGFAGGIGTVTGTMYVAELSPKAIRGLMGAFFSTNTLLGIALGYWSVCPSYSSSPRDGTDALMSTQGQLRLAAQHLEWLAVAVAHAVARADDPGHHPRRMRASHHRVASFLDLQGQGREGAPPAGQDSTPARGPWCVRLGCGSIRHALEC